REAAATSPLLRPLLNGTYDAYTVIAPTTIISFAGLNSQSISVQNGLLTAKSDTSATSLIARVNWFPRWTATVDGHPAQITPRSDLGRTRTGHRLCRAAAHRACRTARCDSPDRRGGIEEGITEPRSPRHRRSG